MPYYSISYNVDQKNGENVGNSYNKFLIQDLLREHLDYEGVVCTDWGITADLGMREEEFAGKCWGVENITVAERHLKALEAGVDQFGGNNDAEPILKAYRMGCVKYGESVMRARFERSAYRLLLNIFRTGLFENPYLDLEKSLQTVGCKEFVEKGFLSQLRSVTLLKNKSHVLPLKEKIRVYIPRRHIRPYLNFMSMLTEEQLVEPAGKEVAGDYFEVVETPEQADAAICFIESPMSNGYDPRDRANGGNGYVPVTLQYRPYQAEYAKEHSIAGGDPLESFTDRSYNGKWNTAANEEDLDLVVDTKKKMGEKPVIVSVSLKNPMVMAEIEPFSDAMLLDYGVTPQAILDVIVGRFTPVGLLPIQMPEDMKTVEEQKEDIAFDMECYRDSEGHVYDFGYGMNFDGVISDERTKKYVK